MDLSALALGCGDSAVLLLNLSLLFIYLNTWVKYIYACRGISRA